MKILQHRDVLSIVLAGGMGDRLYPLTRDRAKPAVPFGGRYRIVDFVLNNLVNSSTGVKEYNVHFAGAILAALPTLIVYITSGRYFVRGLMAGAVKG